MTQITGYRVLNSADLAAINDLKRIGNNAMAETKGILDALRETEGSAIAFDPRWAAKGQTALQEAFMFYTRAVAQPDGI